MAVLIITAHILTSDLFKVYPYIQDSCHEYKSAIRYNLLIFLLADRYSALLFHYLFSPQQGIGKCLFSISKLVKRAIFVSV